MTRELRQGNEKGDPTKKGALRNPYKGSLSGELTRGAREGRPKEREE